MISFISLSINNVSVSIYLSDLTRPLNKRLVNSVLSPCVHQEELDHMRITMGEELRQQQESIQHAKDSISKVRPSLSVALAF